MTTSIEFKIKRAAFIPAKGKQGARVGLVFSNEETENLLFSLPVEWIHGRIKKYVGKKLREIHLDCLIGSTVEGEKSEILRAGFAYNEDGDTLTKDRLEIEKPVLILNAKKAKKALLADADFFKMSDVISVWSKEGNQKVASKVDLTSAKKKAAAFDDDDDAIVPPKKLKKAVAEEQGM